MRAVAAFPSQRRLGMVDFPEPELSTPTQVKMRVLEVGLCGTDREIAAFQYGEPPHGAPYLVIGHESLAEVIEIGPEVTRVRPGDLVVPSVRRPCSHPECLACRAGRQDFCLTGDFTERGIKGAHGYLAERVVEEERWLQPVPRELAASAVLTEPLTIAEKAIQEVENIQRRLPWPSGPDDAARPAQRAVVLGAGPVGLLGAMALRARGYRTVVYSRGRPGAGKAAWVPAIGAEYVSSEEEGFGALAARLGNVDLIYEATGAAPISFQVLESLGTNGLFVFTGVPGRKSQVAFDGAAVMRNLVLRNQLVLGTVNAGPAAFEAAVRDLWTFSRRWPEPLAALITGRRPMEEVPELLIRPSGGIKTVVTIAEAA